MGPPPFVFCQSYSGSKTESSSGNKWNWASTRPARDFCLNSLSSSQLNISGEGKSVLLSLAKIGSSLPDLPPGYAREFFSCPNIRQFLLAIYFQAATDEYHSVYQIPWNTQIMCQIIFTHLILNMSRAEYHPNRQGG